MAAPIDWEPRIEKRKVAFEDIRNSTIDDFRNQLINKYLEDLERESLLKKCDVLHEQCQPKAGSISVRNYKYDRGRLEEVDRLRHEIVHGLDIGEKFRDVEDTLGYLNRTWFYFFFMLVKKYDVKIDVYYLYQKAQAGD